MQVRQPEGEIIMLFKRPRDLFWPFCNGGLEVKISRYGITGRFCLVKLSGEWCFSRDAFKLVPNFGLLGWEKFRIKLMRNWHVLEFDVSQLKPHRNQFCSPFVATVVEFINIADKRHADFRIIFGNEMQAVDFCRIVSLSRLTPMFKGRVCLGPDKTKIDVEEIVEKHSKPDPALV